MLPPIAVGDRRADADPARPGRASGEALLGSLVLVAVGTLVLVGGWVLNVEVLRTLVPGLASTKPVTALCFIFAGLSTGMFARFGPQGPSRWIGSGAAVVVLLLATVALLDHRTAWSGGWLGGATHPLQMSEATAWGFALGGSALAGLWLGAPRAWVLPMSVALATLAGATINGYVYDVEALYSTPAFRSLALPTAAAFTVWALSLLAADHGLIALVRARTVGGQVARRALPLAVFVPFFLGWLSEVGIRGGYFDARLAPALLAATATALLGGLCWRYAAGLHSTELEHARLTEQLHRKDHLEAVGRVAGRVAHDFNNYLTVIGVAARFALDDTENESVRQELRTISEAGNRAAELTRQLLSFSRGRLSPQSSTSVNEVLEGDEVILSRLVPRTVSLRLEKCEGPTVVNLSAGSIGQIVTNLVVNACDAMPEGGTLTIETRNTALDSSYLDEFVEVPKGAYVVLLVADTGLGMDRATRSQVFEPYFTTKATGKGTGLGLATVYGLVRQAGGFVGLYSEAGRGTTIKIFLPHAEKAPTTLVPDSPPRAGRGGETILVVDDDAAIRKTLGRALQRHGYQVVMAEDGAAALQAMSTLARVDLVLSDVMMSGMTGVELATALARRTPPTPVILLSGYAEEAVTPDVNVPPHVAFLEKPFDLTELRRRVREVLDTPGRAGAGAPEGRSAG